MWSWQRDVQARKHSHNVLHLIKLFLFAYCIELFVRTTLKTANLKRAGLMAESSSSGMLCQRSKPPTTSRNGLRGRFRGGQAVNKPTVCHLADALLSIVPCIISMTCMVFIFLASQTHWMPPMHLLPLLPFAHSQVKHMEYDLLHWMAKLSQLRQVSICVCGSEHSFIRCRYVWASFKFTTHTNKERSRRHGIVSQAVLCSYM